MQVPAYQEPYEARGRASLESQRCQRETRRVMTGRRCAGVHGTALGVQGVDQGLW